MISANTNSNISQKMPSVESSVNMEIKSFASNDLEDKFKADEDALSLNQIPENISSGSSINIMVSSSSSCGNVGSSSSSSLGNQDLVKNNQKDQTSLVVGSELSSSSRRSSISGDLEPKITKETKSSKSLRKTKRVNAPKARKNRRLTRKKRELHNEDADDDESDNVFDESENDSALEKDINEKNRKFNCLDLDLFDYLLKRNFLKSINQNQSDVKILNSTAKQRKLSLFTASSDLNDFENNLNINKYFYELIKNGKKLDNVRSRGTNGEKMDTEVNELMNEMLLQVEKNVTQEPKQSLIKTLLQDMSSLNSLSPKDSNFKPNDDHAESIACLTNELNNLSTHDEKNSKENFEIQEEAKKVESNINNEDELRSMEKTSLNTKLNSCVNEKENNLVKTNMNENIKLTSGESGNLSCQSDIVTEVNGNVKKVILKNKEVVLIEDCLDDEDEEEKRLKLLKLNNKNAQNLINDSATPVPRREKNDTMSKSQTFTLPKASKARQQEDDPYVKAALERFDAFCKSKSSHNLDQTGSNPTTPAFVLNRQKSPYLTRKSSASSQSEADPSIKESLSSFIKRRSARVDPNKTDLTSRSASESRADTNKPLSSSSLAKKFLGSLSPQLAPVETTETHNLVAHDSKTNSTCTSPSISETNSSAHNSPPTSPSHQSKSKVIKLEVLNSKNRPVKSAENKAATTPATNKPPIPPSPTLPSAKSKNPKTNQTSVEKTTKTTVSPNQNAKPVSRIIPIEIKNSKNSTKASGVQQQQPQPQLQQQQQQRTPAKSVERAMSSDLDDARTAIHSSPSVQDRIRSLSTSYREDLTDRGGYHSRLGEEATNSVSPRPSGNIYDSVMRQNPITDSRPDPIVEKACNNFLNRLKEFQRLHSSQYQSYSYTSPSTYSGPIVTARNTNPSVEPSSTPSYKSFYSSTYSPSMSSSYHEPASFSKSSCDNDSSSSPRPYVSAIRKRRTLFSDGFDSASTEIRADPNEFSYAKSESEYSQYSARSESDDSKSGLAKNRPLSIVSEEANVSVLRSHTINENRPKDAQEKIKSLKKSNSITSSSPSKTETPGKIRSTVFDRLCVNPSPVSESKACAKSSSSLNAKATANYEIKKKEENEIAVVNSVVPKTRRESTSSIGNTASSSSSALNRIRSLDPKNRDKFKSTASLKQNTKPATNVATSTNVPACYLYPCPDVKQTGVLKSSSNTSTKSSEETRRKSQTSKNSAESKKDVFERLSKRANSMKNLSNKSKNSSSCSSSGEEADHRALGDENEDSVYQSSQNSGSSKTSVFERLYKSNIAAHMSQDESKNSTLKKNMSVSSANLNGQANQNGAKKTNLNKSKGYINTRVSLKNRKDDSANDESNESKISDSELGKNESPRDLSKSSFLCKKLMDLYDK